jgi:hypothetical protein
MLSDSMKGIAETLKQLTLAGQAKPAQNTTEIPVESQSQQQVPVEPRLQQFQQFQQPQFATLQPLAPALSRRTQIRISDGRINLDVNREDHRRMNAQKRRVWKAWLKIMLEKDGKRLGEI